MNYKVFSLKILELQYNAAKVSLAAAIQCICIMIELSLMTIGNYSSWERRKAKKLEKTSVSQIEICGLSLLVLYSATRGFLWVLRFPLSLRTKI